MEKRENPKKESRRLGSEDPRGGWLGLFSYLSSAKRQVCKYVEYESEEKMESRKPASLESDKLTFASVVAMTPRATGHSHTTHNPFQSACLSTSRTSPLLRPNEAD